MLAYSTTFEAIGTQWQISSSQQLSADVISQIEKRIDEFDATYSRFRPDSLVTRIAQKAGIYTFPADAPPLLNFYRQLYDISKGHTTPLIGSMLERAGYDATYSFRERPQRPIQSWDTVMTREGRTLTTSSPITLDFGAAGKGYLVDILSDILEFHAVANFVIDASGDLRHKGTSEHRVGLEHPLDPTSVIGVVDVCNQSLCASAANRRAWGSMHHVFNPHTGLPVDKIIATWVIAKSALVADGIATALFMTEPAALQSQYDFQYVRMHAGGAIDYSPSLEGQLFA